MPPAFYFALAQWKKVCYNLELSVEWLYLAADSRKYVSFIAKYGVWRKGRLL